MDQKPKKQKKAGLLLLQSRGSERQQSEMERKEFELLEKFKEAKNAGDIQEAVKLIDSLMEFTEEAGQPTFEYQVEKSLLENPGNFSKLIPIYENQLDFYKLKNDSVGRVNALLSLTAVSVNGGSLKQAKEYVDRAEKLFSSISPSEINNLNKKDPITGMTRMEAKWDQIRRAKRHIHEQLENNQHSGS